MSTERNEILASIKANVLNGDGMAEIDAKFLLDEIEHLDRKLAEEQARNIALKGAMQQVETTLAETIGVRNQMQTRINELESVLRKCSGALEHYSAIMGTTEVNYDLGHKAKQALEIAKKAVNA